MTLSRRTFLLGAATALAAPAVVRAESLMKLWVPPTPKLVTSLDVGGPDYTGHLYTKEGTIVGWWKQKNGRMDFRWDDPAPTGYWQSGQSHDYQTVSKVFDMLDVRPYPVRIL